MAVGTTLVQVEGVFIVRQILADGRQGLIHILDRAIQRISDFHIVQGIAVARIGLHPNGVCDSSAAAVIRSKLRSHFGHGCTCTGRKGDSFAIPLVSFGIDICRVLEISLCRDAGIAVHQLDPVGQGSGFVGRHIADVPDQRAGLRRVFTCGIRDGIFLRGCRANVYSSGASGFRGTTRIIGWGRHSRHAHIFLDVLEIRKGIHHLDIRAAIRAGSDCQGVGQIISVCILRDGRDGFGNIHISVFRDDIVVKINVDRCIANDNLILIMIVDLRKIDPGLYIKVTADDCIALCALLGQPGCVKSKGDHIVCHRDGADSRAPAGNRTLGGGIAQQIRHGIGHLPVRIQKAVNGHIVIADLQLEICVARDFRRTGYIGPVRVDICPVIECCACGIAYYIQRTGCFRCTRFRRHPGIGTHLPRCGIGACMPRSGIDGSHHRKPRWDCPCGGLRLCYCSRFLNGFLRWGAFIRMGMLLHATSQLPGSIAAGAMGVVFVLGKRTGQSLGVNRFLHRLKAGVCVLMLQHLDFAADQIAVSVIALRCVLVKNDLRFLANQHRLSIFLRNAYYRFGGQIRVRNLFPFITVISKDIIFF